MKFSDFLKESVKEKAVDVDDLFASIKGGIFMKDGSHLRINGKFDCSFNRLTSLVGAPSSVSGDFDCSDNELTSLAGAPSFVGGDFNCSNNKLKSLVGAPASVGNMWCGDNKIKSLKGAPSEVNGYINCWGNKITNMLGFLRIKNLKSVTLVRGNDAVEDIINKYLPNNRGNDAIFDCQNDLIEAGFEKKAEL